VGSSVVGSVERGDSGNGERAGLEAGEIRVASSAVGSVEREYSGGGA
jgi:hypothetical protein